MCKQKKELSAKERKAKELKDKQKQENFNKLLKVRQTASVVSGAVGIIVSLASLGFMFWLLYTIFDGLRSCGASL